MPYRELLVHLDYTRACDERVKAALSLGKRHGARVKGIALALESSLASYLGISIPSSLNDQEKRTIAEAAKELTDKFETNAEKAGVEHVSEILKCGATKAPQLMAFHARHCDLSFFGQPNPDEESATFIESLYDGVLFRSGRPVYLVPHFGRFELQIRNAVIAWDGSKKAARAVRDAIPLLQGRGETTILIVNPEKRPGAHGEQPGKDLADYLARYDVDAKVSVLANEKISVDTVILNFLAEKAADLLVMGAYNHSKLREKAFGGVTDSIVHQMTAPVFMSE